MEGLEKERAAHRRNLLRQIGVPDLARHMAGQVRTAGHEAEILSLPYFDGDYQAVQNPTTLAPYFMVGISPIGGTDPLG